MLQNLAEEILRAFLLSDGRRIPPESALADDAASMKSTRLATSRAERHSCVTNGHGHAGLGAAPRTSRSIGSAEVGSSEEHDLGFHRDSERADRDALLRPPRPA